MAHPPRPLRAAEYFDLEPAMDYWSCFWGPDDRGLEQIKDSMRFAYDAGYKEGVKAEKERMRAAFELSLGDN
jgi:hypothetical protein